MFARAELDAALEKQQGDINEARKRAMWLEDRMGLLCGKVRMRVGGQMSCVTVKMRTVTYNSRIYDWL